MDIASSVNVIVGVIVDIAIGVGVVSNIASSVNVIVGVIVDIAIGVGVVVDLAIVVVVTTTLERLHCYTSANQ